MRKLSVASLSILAMVVSAHATDLPSRKRAPDMSKITKRAQPFWSGYYGGASFGYGWNTVDVTRGLIGRGYIGPTKGTSEGSLESLRIGYDEMITHDYLVGYLGELTLNNAPRKNQCLIGICDSDEDPSASAHIPLIASFRSRFGYANGETLLYVTSGVAVGEIKSELDSASDPIKRHDLRLGGVVGAGLERQITEKISVGAEYLHYRFGDRVYDYGVDDTRSRLVFGDSLNSVRATVNYKF